jgi:nicotinamide-nucleotide amidase
MKRPVQSLADILKEKRLTIAFAESMSCGMIAHSLGTVSRTSDFFMGSIVCYDESVKTGLLKVPATLIKKYSAESQEVTDALAKKLKRLIKADIYASITGLAAEGGSETKEKPVGTVFYSVIIRGKLSRMKKRFYGTPLSIRKKSADAFFTFIVNEVKKSR